jgi:predicted DNA-binding transcriptional regulator YafY
MPIPQNQVFRIKIIDELLSNRNNDWVTTQEMLTEIKKRLNHYVTIRTIQLDLKVMMKKNEGKDKKLGYGAPIDYNKTKRTYKYSDKYPGYSINNFSLTSKEIDALQFYAECLQVFSGYKIFDSYKNGIEKVIKGVKLKNFIDPQTNSNTIVQTESIARGQEYIEELVSAINKKHEIKIDYHPYYFETEKTLKLLPVFLKEYKNRWYLLAYKFADKRIKAYALDRIKKLNVYETICIDEIKFDPLSYFKHSFGITIPDGDAEEVILKFNATEAAYIKSLPIHSTQEIIEDTTAHLIIKIAVNLSYELYEFILGKSSNIEVLAPQKLIDEVSKKIKETVKVYEKNQRR